MEEQCGIVVLAAGASSRLGRPKQLLVYKQQTLLMHSIAAAIQSAVQQVVLVLGAGAENILPAVGQDKKLAIVINPAWKEGMASSIRVGLNYLLAKTPGLQSALFMACDQPYINAGLIDKLVNLQQQTGQTIVASKYGDTTGIPVVFSKNLFPALLQLEGDTGAKKLVMQYRAELATVEFPMGDIDIDTATDYQQLQNM